MSNLTISETDLIQNNDMPIVVLENGVRIANFSSPHSFKFDDGIELPGCSKERATRLMLRSEEIEVPGVREGVVDIDLQFRMSDVVEAAILEANQDGSVDVVLVPFPVMTCWKSSGRDIGKMRCVRIADRVTKVAHSGKFCR